MSVGFSFLPERHVDARVAHGHAPAAPARRAGVLAQHLQPRRAEHAATPHRAGVRASRITFRNTGIAIWAGTQAIAGAKGLTVRRAISRWRTARSSAGMIRAT